MTGHPDDPFIYRRRVEFVDTDLAGIVHFSNYFRFLEAAEHAFIRSLDLSLHTLAGGHEYGWLRLRTECDYHRPIHLEDEVEIRLSIRHVNRRMLVYDFVFHVPSGGGLVLAASGSLSVACARLDRDTQRYRVDRIPDFIYEKFERILGEAAVVHTGERTHE